MNIKELISDFKEEDFYTKVNLHIHSDCSDGESDFDKLIEQAIELNMKYISITDHNTIEGYKISSATLFKRCISSMKRIYPPFKDINIPIISLGLSREGAEVIFISAFI